MSRIARISVLSGTRQMELMETPVESYRAMKDYWRDAFEKVIYDNPEYIVLPEACDRVLGMNEGDKAVYDELRQAHTLDFFKELAVRYNVSIVFNSRLDSMNSSYAVNPDGSIAGRYDKVFPMSTEMDEGVIPGKKAVICRYGKIERAGFAVCFDLNFRELRDEYISQKPEVIFFSSMYHGGLVQKTWAYETRSFFISSICGRESAITAPNGRILARTTNYTDFCTADINLDSTLIHLDFNRDRFMDIKRKYKEGVSIDDTGYLGSVLMSCEMEDKTIGDIISEFGLIPLDEYFDYAREYRKEHLQ